MHDTAPSCPDCGTAFDPPDNYCRHCGMYLAASREANLPVAATPQPRALEVVRTGAGVPAPVKKAATALAIGAALQVGVGIAGRYLAGQAAREAAKVAAPRANRGRTPLRRPEADQVVEAAAVSETVVIRRVWIRRA